jgi:hypothetical protein
MRIDLNGDSAFLTMILGSVLQKVEGKIFLSEVESVTMRNLIVSITYDETKRGWWVSLEEGTMA